ncbi:MAG: PLDc N-terminal domain-containing protein [Planctomycetes bacterium]|nr:PLDc N-terminal domain-containing protein [Planctomycetota bacterium]
MIALLAADQPLTLLHVIALAIGATGEVLAFFFVYRVLIRGGSPASNLLWVVVILAAPWIGLLLYYLFPRQLQLRRMRRIRQRGQRVSSARGAASGALATVDDRDRGLLALFDAEDGLGPGLSGGNQLQWIPGAEEFFAAAETAIAAAKHEIHCEVYILRPDAAGQAFLAWLTAAAARGVTVRLLYDSIGSFGLKAVHLEPLRRAGGRAIPFLPLLWKRRPFTINLRNHRKSLIIDGELGFVGGRNIGNEYRTGRLLGEQRWHDAMVELRGPAVGRLQDTFVMDWCTACDEVLGDARRPASEPAGSQAAAITCSGPDRERPMLWYAMLQALAEARESIDLCSPYMLPPPVVFHALEVAVARGVRVRLFTNGRKAEAMILYWAQRTYYARLLKVGAEIWETELDYDHSKLLVVDRRTVMVGSANLDLRSAALNFEIAVVAVGAAGFAEAVLATIEERQALRRRVTRDGLPRSPLVRVLDGIATLASPLL